MSKNKILVSIGVILVTIAAYITPVLGCSALHGETEIPESLLD